MSDPVCTKYGCDYQLDLDGQVTCAICGAMDDDASTPITLDIDNAPTPVTLDIFDNQVDFE